MLEKWTKCRHDKEKVRILKIIEKVASFHLISSLGTMGLNQFVASKYAIMKMLKRTLVVLLVNCLPSFFFNKKISKYTKN